MSGAGDIVTAHAVLRWLERIEGADMSALRLAARADGINPRRDYALVAWLEETAAVDIARVRRLIDCGRVRLALAMGAKSVRIGRGAVAHLRSGKVVSIIPARRERHRLWTPYGDDKGRHRRGRPEPRGGRRFFLDAAE